MRRIRLTHGFTLTEILVAVSIIAVLSIIVIVGINAARHRARVAEAYAEMRQVRAAIGVLQLDTGQWPARYDVQSPPEDYEGCLLTLHYRTPYQVCGTGTSPTDCGGNEVNNLTGALSDSPNSAYGGLTTQPGRKACSHSFTTCVSNGNCPSGETCVNNTSQEPYGAGWKGPYISKPIYDPWGEPYIMDCDYENYCVGGQRYISSVIFSAGPDGDDSECSDDNIVLELARGPLHPSLPNSCC